MKITLFGYAKEFPYGGDYQRFNSRQKAEEIRQLLGNKPEMTIFDIGETTKELIGGKEDSPYGSPHSVNLDKCPYYEYLADRSEAVRLQEHLGIAGYPTLEVEVEAIAKHSQVEGNQHWAPYQKTLVRGYLPLDRFGKQKYRLFHIPLNVNMESVPQLSEAAIELYNLLSVSDSRLDYYPVDEFYSLLVRIQAKNSSRIVVQSAIENRPFATDRIEAFTYSTSTGIETIWVYSVGYSEGYIFDIFGDLKAAKRHLYQEVPRRGWIDLECWECGATFTEAGHVEPGQMGCDRCNN